MKKIEMYAIYETEVAQIAPGDYKMLKRAYYKDCPMEDDFEKIEIELPDFVDVYKNAAGNMCFEIDGLCDFAGSFLTQSKNGSPMLRLCDASSEKFYPLKYRVVKQSER